MAALVVRRAGMLTTVQDLGRWGWQGQGVPVAGAMDAYSHRLANRLVGNEDGEAGLEVTLVGPELQAEGDVVCAVAGASFSLAVDGRPVEMHRAFALRGGQSLKFGERRAGARATLAVAGGLALEPVFGSRSSSLVSRMGPVPRTLVPGDRLPVGTAAAWRPAPAGRPLPLPAAGTRLRVLPGPHEHLFDADAAAGFFGARYIVTPQSNRMGYRLDGRPLAHQGSADILSDATPMGSIQVPGSGLPILLMADRQTTGGYPRIGTVISADLPLAGQLAPGDWIEFVACSRREAVEALRRRVARLAGRGA